MASTRNVDDDGWCPPLVNGDAHQQYAKASPFPHIVVDSFCDAAATLAVERELRALPQAVWDAHRDPLAKELPQQRRKTSIKDARVMPPATRAMVELFASPAMIAWMERTTGIPALHADSTLMGGGVHRVDDGGSLAVHADFNVHPDNQRHRRVNAILYLNDAWTPACGGELELWSAAPDDRTRLLRCERRIEPLLNRLVVFNITDDAYHGHPEPWRGGADLPRLSLAFYYYTDDRPAHERSPPHWALWKQRPDGIGW